MAALIILALLGSGLGAYFLFFHTNNPTVVPPVAGGQAVFLSSGQFNSGTAQGMDRFYQE